MPCRCFRSPCVRASRCHATHGRPAWHATARQRGMILFDSLLALLILTAGLAALTTIVLHGLRDNRATARTAQAVRLLHDGAEQLRLDPAGAWLVQWQRDIASALPAGSGQRTARSLIVEWHDTQDAMSRRLELPLAP